MKKMPSNKIDLIGKRFGRLLVIKQSDVVKNSQARWICQCDCGNIKTIVGSSLRRGVSNSCGCAHKEMLSKKFSKHHQCFTPEYSAWQNMRSRCYNIKNTKYSDYGGRGIGVCDRWKNSFEKFFNDMGNKPSDIHSLDRYPDNDGNYEPNNCRWGTYEQQARNKRNNVWIEQGGIKMIVNDWAKKTGINRGVISRRLNAKNIDDPLRPMGMVKSG